ncbi:hypothetical protein F5B22DRAFT_500854 [Xylaria bambusicola]|uniref:uncharacterized protein n=1 Tax=Xylaria bambusicola TaxID=326684 RepID=UPI00200845EE|nr:uncharacterized protein F5B22DRAFT_500854 [Xylaria bambusicola]KAI0521758.1 hypothetical protein F5B22DRAFT_500854 [Xylaria bambusicola]
MYNTKVLLSVAVFAGVSIAQTSTPFPDPACASSVTALVAAAPTVPADVAAAIEAEYSGGADPNLNLLQDPAAYVSLLCGVAAELPPPALSNFKTFGSSLLAFAATELASYDGIVTKCVTTGAAAASITSYIHSIASFPGQLCNVVASPTNGTSSAPPYPTATGNGTTTSTGLPTSSISMAGAAMPTGVLAGAAAVGGLLGAVAML